MDHFENWTSYHQEGLIVCLTFIRISYPDCDDQFYTRTSRTTNYDVSFFYEPASMVLNYSKSPPIVIPSPFRWTTYHTNEDGSQISIAICTN